jgi:hypothetical protein
VSSVNVWQVTMRQRGPPPNNACCVLISNCCCVVAILGVFAGFVMVFANCSSEASCAPDVFDLCCARMMSHGGGVDVDRCVNATIYEHNACVDGTLHMCSGALVVPPNVTKSCGSFLIGGIIAGCAIAMSASAMFVDACLAPTTPAATNRVECLTVTFATPVNVEIVARPPAYASDDDDDDEDVGVEETLKSLV